MPKEKDSDYIGLTLEHFKTLYPDQDFRIERLDGNPRRLNADFNPERINLTIENNVIVSVDWF